MNFLPKGAAFELRYRRAESGSIVILSCFVLVMIFVVVGLAIDSGNLYRAKIGLQKAADAAALATVSYVIAQGTQVVYESAYMAAGISADDSAESRAAALSTYLLPYARQIAYANMAIANLPDDVANGRGVTVEAVYVPMNAASPNVYRYDVTVRRKIDFLLMDLLPLWKGTPGNGWADLSASASVVRKVVWSTIFLDVSHSMTCPRVGECDCITAARETSSCPLTDTKFDALLEAVQAYVETFDLERDQLVFVPFNIRAEAFTAQEAIERARAITGQNLSGASALIGYIRSNYNPANMTNLCDAFTAGFEKITDLLNSLGVQGNERIEYVLFTDGAPTAGRYLFDDLRNGSGLPSWPANSGKHDYVFHNIEWVDRDNHSLIGPSLLSQYGAFPIQSYFGNLDIEPPPPTQDGGPRLVTCNGSPAAPPAVGNLADKRSAANAVFGSCFNSFRSHVPGQPYLQYGGEYRPYQGGAGSSFADFAELHYICPLMLADAMREGPFRTRRGRGRFSVIGVGDPAPALANPFQNAEEAETRHDVFLARLALDKGKFDSIPVYQLASLPTPEFQFEGYSSFENQQESNYYHELTGQYYPEPNVGDLKNLFRTVARKVALRYIQ